MAVKTNMSKAYDQLEWNFIQCVLTQLGFHVVWVNWIMQCISTVSFSFLLNRSPRGLAKPKRGIRHGDLISSYLFILCGEVLSGMCHRAQEKGKLLGIKVARGCSRVNHLLFADDTMFFCKANVKSCKELKRILSSYTEVSGQLINYQKSSISFSRKTPLRIKTKMKRILQIKSEGGVGK